MLDFTLLYNDAILKFLAHLELRTKQILENEMHIEVKRKRFIYNEFSCPLKVVVFEHPNMLGYFKFELFELGFNKALISADSQTLDDIIRHELAHYICALKYGNNINPHGQEYHQLCNSFNWPAHVATAKAALNIPLLNQKEQQQSKILNRVKKLLKLSNSSNQHEAEQAALKANELILKHNLELLNSDKEFDTVLKRVISGKRINAKARAIAHILRLYFVSPIFNHSTDGFYLELIGSRSNVEFASYVADFLNYQLDYLWQQAKREFNLSGVSAKNSFMLGLADGFYQKQRQAQYTHSNNKELITLNQQVEEHKRRVYKRNSYSSCNSRPNFTALNLGKKQGQQLSINPALKNKVRKFFLE